MASGASFEPFAGPANPCGPLCRRFLEAWLRDVGRQDPDYHPEERVDCEPSRDNARPIGLGSPFCGAPLTLGTRSRTEYSPWAADFDVGVWIDAGSRAETDETSGTAHFLEHLAFKVRLEAGMEFFMVYDADDYIKGTAKRSSTSWNLS